MMADVTQLFDGAAEFERHCLGGTTPIVTYKSLAEEYGRLGLQPGSAILILAPNGLEFLQHWLAILSNGLVPVAISPSARSPRINRLRHEFGLAGVVGVKINPSLYDASDFTAVGTFRFVRFHGVRPRYSPHEVLILTSGTSGVDSACVHRVDSLIANAALHNQALGIRSTDRQLVVLPMYYSFALVAQAIGSMICGCQLIIDGPPFANEHFFARITDKRISVSAITPTLVRGILPYINNIPRLRVISVGGDQLSVNDARTLKYSGAADEIYFTYGLTEAGPRVSTLAAHEEPDAKLGSVGRVFPGIETRIEARAGAKAGELMLRTPTALLRKVGGAGKHPLDPDGWLRTGDLFTCDREGYLTYQGRLRDFVIIQGEKVNIKSVSRIAEEHPDVHHARAYVDGDGSLALSLQFRQTADVSVEIIKKFLRERLQRFEVPKNIVQVDSVEFRK
ncbi:class I adenylate-forming enzyme family protein [Nguyenibacter vanlangensis]|uniref:Acyl--CoA ligase n=1 Tax=Nguyenibacter vanlangensis TaxID=1216886 RepID=A0A7Y7ITJ2_9PROT|nr:class I adenylate-forming enzyme family protein [Nguyenibacter vanlangensis]NVN10071.1 acyl--CoA ligase [Nguyenibacter vanlangensis]